ncbi:MAG: SDR family NAD(P)-dependent oxidoreductase, partial [Anaerolineales bacterium]|nr:SDR family NAD(P)-dependent oxidoreductase [Anaerolineales bacterium]
MKQIQELMDLSGRVALITGGAGHIGRACGDALAELGASIAVLDFNKESCEQTAITIHNEYGVKTLPLVVDLADEDNLQAVPQRILDYFGC